MTFRERIQSAGEILPAAWAGFRAALTAMVYGLRETWDAMWLVGGIMYRARRKRRPVALQPKPKAKPYRCTLRGGRVYGARSAPTELCGREYNDAIRRRPRGGSR